MSCRVVCCRGASRTRRACHLRDAALDLGELLLLPPQLRVDVPVQSVDALALVVAVGHALVRVGPAPPPLCTHETRPLLLLTISYLLYYANICVRVIAGQRLQGPLVYF